MEPHRELIGGAETLEGIGLRHEDDLGRDGSRHSMVRIQRHLDLLKRPRRVHIQARLAHDSLPCVVRVELLQDHSRVVTHHLR